MTPQQPLDSDAESDVRFHQLADFIPQLVWTARPDGYLDYYNKQWYDYTGFEEGYGDQSWLPILHPDDAQLCLDAWYNSVQTGEEYEIEYRFVDRKKPGEYRWFLGRACPIKNSSGQIIKWIGTCTDIDDQRRKSETLEQLVVERTRQLDQANTRLKHSNDRLQHFASVASHDLQEPLRKVFAFSQLLAEQYSQELGRDGVDLLGRMQRAVERMSGLIRDILGYSRLTTQTATPTLVNLGDVVSEVLSDLELTIQEKQAIIRVDSLPTVTGAASQLRQLFQNLLGNALKFQASGTRPVVEVTVNQTSPRAMPPELAPSLESDETLFWEISIVDNGIGFDEQHRERIFQLFERLHGRSQYEGTGIGLALCKQIVEQHNGFITARSQPGAGAVFSVYLPVSSVQFNGDQ
ncbi:sensor histidine kinase [Spirosoma arcticum]